MYFVFSQGVKNEAEAYMLKELSLLKWQEKATNLASEDNATKILELQTNVCSLEENLKIERQSFPNNLLLVYVFLATNSAS